MRQRMAVILSVSILLTAGLAARPSLAQVPACQLAPVFLMLRDLIGKDRTGECTSVVLRNESGDLNQPTTRGMLTFRPSDLVVAFSDDQTTFLYGPNGLESRPIGTRLAWEGTGATIAAASASAPVAAAPLPPPPPSSAAAPAIAPPTALPFKIDGNESATTKAFDLAGGDYAVAWEAERQRGKSSCYVGANLRRAEDPSPGSPILMTTLNTTNERAATGESRVFGVAPGRYVFDVSTTGCTWKLTVKAPS